MFIGAFFLMNLTLAVVNASFTKSQKEAVASDKELIKAADAVIKGLKPDNFDEEMNEAL